jgi:hypothetical protein
MGDKPMPFYMSPAVGVTETDLTTIIPAVSTTSAANVGDFQWGPCYEPIVIDSEEPLISTFWKPNSRNYVDFFSAWNFLNYSNSLYNVRVVNTTNANTSLQAHNACDANSHGTLILNDHEYVNNFLDGELDTEYHAGSWAAAYPGLIGNSLTVHVCASSNAYSRTLTGTVTVQSGNTTVVGSGTQFSTQVTTGDYLLINGETHQVTAVANSTSLTLDRSHAYGAAANTATRFWEFYNEFTSAPNTSIYAAARSSSKDELHVVVTDKLGKWTGQEGAILETFPFLSKASDATAESGETIFYRDAILAKSKYIRWASHAGTLTNAGKSITTNGATVFGGPLMPLKYDLIGGSDGTTLTNSERMRGWDLFKSPEDIDVTLLIGGAADSTLANYVIQNISETRMDTIAFVSPPMATVVNNAGEEAIDAVNFRNQLTSTSRASMESGWRYQYDKWNDVYRWTPLNADIAGLMARTAALKDPWWSPAGYSRGLIKNVYKLAWNPRRAYRDILYRSSINPVISDKGSGVLLFGDKTLLDRESAFSYLNVRMLFIVLEKAIASAAKVQLFEFNDEFSWANFKNMVEPYLRDVQGRRGIIRFKVVCDATNNTPQVINSGGFVGDIYVQPNRSTQWIQLNFVAVRAGVEFSEIVGKF